VFIVSHRIAGLVFRTEASVPLPRLGEEPFRQFLVDNDRPPDVCHYIHKIPLAALTLPALSGEEWAQRLRGVEVEPGALDSPLLRAPAVQTWLQASLNRSASVSISLLYDRLIGRDFAQRRFDFFYLEKSEAPESTEQEVERPVRSEGKPAPCFRQHVINTDPRTVAPLTMETRAQLTRSIRFWPPDTVESPLLRTPEVQAWLKVAQERAEEVAASIYLDGVALWNLSQNRIDFFYYPEYGPTVEGRVAAYFRRMFATFLPDFSALMVHSSGLIRNQRAALFLAPDEGGKTTVLRRAPGGLFLNDDQIVLRREGEQFVAHSTPLGRITSGPCQARLGGLFVLEKATTFRLTPVPAAGLVRRLWEEHTIYTAVLPRALKQRAFNLFYDLCHQVPVYKMQFPQDDIDWNAIDAAMAD